MEHCFEIPGHSVGAFPLLLPSGVNHCILWWYCADVNQGGIVMSRAMYNLALVAVLLAGLSSRGSPSSFQESGNHAALDAESSDISIGSVHCEYLANPRGIDVVRPRLSWVLSSDTRGQKQTAYQILVSSSQKELQEDMGDLWDSGKVASDQSIHVEYNGQELGSRQQCYWKVRVWDKTMKVSEWSRPASWSMGLLGSSDWKATWIKRKDVEPQGATFSDGPRSPYPLPVFRKVFRAQQAIQDARVYVCGLGHYELFLNGKKVGSNFLEPAWSVYEKTVYYNTYDITEMLQLGENAFGAMLGKGFYSTKGDRRIHGVDADRPLMLILQAHIRYRDGSEQIVRSDSSWKVADGPIQHCAILGGSDYDARLLPKDWDKPSYDDSAWQYAEQTRGPGGVLRACPAPPMQVFSVFKPEKIDEPEKGYYVYDFGQNASAKPRLTIRGKPGQVVRLAPAEQRHGQTGVANNGAGRVNQAGVGSPNYWQYTLRGDPEETWTPQFTYSGYQYIEVSGAVPEGRPNPDRLPVVRELVSLQVRNASSQVGSFECSNALLNQTNRLIDWAVQSNLAHVLTDCPHREKLGWLEVSYLMAPSISWNYDIAAFYTKVLRDIADSQDSNGCIYTVAPDYPRFEGGFRYSPEWGAAGVFLAWHLYQWYGDRRVLEQSFSMMKKYVDYMYATSDALIAKPGLGDWYDYGHGKSLGPSRFTPVTQTATVIFYGCSRVVSDAARILGRTEDYEHYSNLCGAIKEAFNREFFDGRAVYQNYGSPQTANSMALVLGLVEPGREQAVLGSILADLQERHYQQTAGDVGYHYLVEALDDYGCSDVLYRIVNRYDVGSYGYILKQGWTSMPEAWDATLSSSMNHCMLGHIQQWFFEGLGGIAPDYPGFGAVKIQPEMIPDLDECSCDYQSVHGMIRSHWRRSGEGVHAMITVPVNTTATVYFPQEYRGGILEGGSPVEKAEGVHFISRQSGQVLYGLQSGTYRFLLKDGRP